MKSNLTWYDKCKDATTHWEGKCLICEDESKGQPQDTTVAQSLPSNIDDDTFDPANRSNEEDGELNVTPGEWYLERKSAGIAIYSPVAPSSRHSRQIVASIYGMDQQEDNAALLLQAKNMYAALKVFADIDLTGVTGHIVYQRNESFIKVSDVINARTILNNCKPKP